MSQLSDRSKTIIPILLEDCEVPSILKAISVAEFHEDYAEGLKRLLSAVKPDGSSADASAAEEPQFTASADSLSPLTTPGKAEAAPDVSAGPATLHIEQEARDNNKYGIKLILERANQAKLTAQAEIEFALTPQEQEELRWYLEDYLQRAESVEKVQVEQIETLMKQRGEELYRKVLRANDDTQDLWSSIRNNLSDLRVEISTGIAEAASIPWELMYEPQSDSPIALRVKSFVRVQSNPNVSFVPVPQTEGGRVRLLYVVCRPRGTEDVALRTVANRLLQDLGEDRGRYDITALRPPTYEQLQKELTDAKEAGRPYHIVHFDGHGIYTDLSKTTMAWWFTQLSSIALGGEGSGKHGYLLFEHPGSEEKMRPVLGDELGRLLHDTGVPVLVLNACQSAMHEALEKPDNADTVHDEVHAIGSLAQAVIDQGIPAVLGMRYSVFVVTAAQYIGELYAAVAKGRGFGQAATEGRKHLHRNPDRWVGLQPRPLQDWFVPVVYEAAPLQLLPADKPLQLGEQPELDPVQRNSALLRYVPDHGFVGRDETLLMLDRAFDDHAVVLLHAYAGQGKTTTAVEFARWYAQTGGLGEQPIVLLTSFESHTDLDDVLNQIGGAFAPVLQAQGIEWHALNDTGERRTLVLQLLRQIPVLWIWDNVEPVAGFPEGTESAWTADEQAELADFLKGLKLDRATKVKILLTSRRDEQQWLGGVPHRVKMPPMSASDAAGLALQLGQEKNLTRPEIADWGPLLDYCAGNPLTLRVIAGQAVKMGLRGDEQIAAFIQAVRDSEQHIEDADEAQGRDRSLGASLDYGFRNAFKEDELPVIALLHLFQGTVDVEVLAAMGKVEDHAIPEVKDRTNEDFTSLLERAGDIGLLTQIGPTYFTIHPALPWFLGQLFARHYDGQDGRPSAEAARRAWVEAVSALGNYYHQQFIGGNRDVIQFLALEEANLLHTRRHARRHGWWWPVTCAMQGLRTLYQHQGRGAEWARLVAEIVPDFCTADDEPGPGREGGYTLVMAYRIDLARYQERNLPRAAVLQEKLTKLHRRQAAPTLALPADAPLDAAQRNRIRSLGVSFTILGQILREQGSSDCVEHYKASIQQYQRIQDTAVEAITHFNLGHTYYEISDIRDLDAAEAAYQRSLALCDTDDALGRSRCIKQIGMVHHERFMETRQRDEPEETVLRYAQAAEAHYQQSLALRPASDIGSGPTHNQLGLLYNAVGQTERAREHYEKAAQYAEQAGNRHSAGTTRQNMAVMYAQAAGREDTPARRRDFLLRAQAYAQAALRDFQHYEGRAAANEAKVQQLLDEIGQLLAQQPE